MKTKVNAYPTFEKPAPVHSGTGPVSRTPGHAARKIVLTGGGSTGHVSVNLALIPGLLGDGWQVDYMVSAAGIEQELISPIPGVRYHAFQRASCAAIGTSRT